MNQIFEAELQGQVTWLVSYFIDYSLEKIQGLN